MRKAVVYVGKDRERLDLFKDEEINVTSTIQNIQDIAKVFTDFSQTFTVPASEKNNKIFKHYYQNDVEGGFIAKNRITATLEIDYTLFRRGKLQLEGAEIKDNKVESYKVTFYGDVVTLKDKFGEDKLSDLDYDSINEEYTGANVQASITSTADLDVRYPLITSERLWVDSGSGTDDITVSGGAINYTELFPAIKVAKIFEFIEDQYDITFEGNFLNTKPFTNLFTWFKNRDVPDFTTEGRRLQWTSSSGGALANYSAISPYFSGVCALYYREPFGTVYPYYPIPAGASVVGNQTHSLEIYINPSTTDTYYLDVYQDNTLITTITSSGSQVFYIAQIQNDPSLDTKFAFRVRADVVMTVTGTVRYDFTYSYDLSGTIYNLVDTQVEVIDTELLSVYYDFANVAPDMKIADYFAGILKMFNLTCFPLSEDTFQIEPLDIWYNAGGEVNITPYVDTKSIKVDRPKLYKEISFNYEKCKSFMNVDFKGAYTREYGSLAHNFGYDGGKFEIKLPFENLLFNKFTGGNLQVGYHLDKATGGKTYVPKVTNLYLNESKSTYFYFNDGTTANIISSYMPFGQDLEYNLQNYSSNFGSEVSTLLDIPINNSLYRIYYEPYLLNLFNDKTRIVKLKAILSLPMLSTLTLDDAVILRDKKYRINSMKSNLSTGVVDLELISDWIVNRGKPPVVPPVDDTGGVIVVPIKPVKPPKPTKPTGGGGGYVKILAPLETSFITGSPTLPATITTEQNITLTIASNSGAERINTIPFEYYDADNNKMFTEYLVITQKSTADNLLTEDSKAILTERIENIIV